jgi:hypothetical protein
MPGINGQLPNVFQTLKGENMQIWSDQPCKRERERFYQQRTYQRWCINAGNGMRVDAHNHAVEGNSNWKTQYQPTLSQFSKHIRVLVVAKMGLEGNGQWEGWFSSLWIASNAGILLRERNDHSEDLLPSAIPTSTDLFSQITHNWFLRALHSGCTE